MELNEWAFIAVFVAIAAILPAAPILMGWMLGPRKPNAIKNDTYECGIETVGDTWVQFKVQYYIFALVFVVFDVEMVFLFPWAVAYGSLGFFAFVEVFVFIVLLAVALVYVWRKGALEWT